MKPSEKYMLCTDQREATIKSWWGRCWSLKEKCWKTFRRRNAEMMGMSFCNTRAFSDVWFHTAVTAENFQRPFQNKVSFGNTPNFLRHSSISPEWGDEKGKIKKNNRKQASSPPFVFKLFTTHLSGNSNDRSAAIASSQFSLGPPDLVGMTALRNKAAGTAVQSLWRKRRQCWIGSSVQEAELAVI